MARQRTSRARQIFAVPGYGPGPALHGVPAGTLQFGQGTEKIAGARLGVLLDKVFAI